MRPIIAKYIDRAQKMALELLEKGKKEFVKIKDQVMDEVCFINRRVTLILLYILWIISSNIGLMKEGKM